MNSIIKKVLDERQTVKSYSEQAIPEAEWNQIIDTIQWAPSSHGFEPYRVLIINRNNKLREELKPAMWNQGVVTEADKLVIFISLKRSVFASEQFLTTRIERRLKDIGGKTGEELKELVKKQVEFTKKTHLDAQELTDDWSMKQTYIALGMAMYSAAILGIGSTPIEGFMRDDLEKILLSHKLITENERASVAVTFGYPKAQTSYAHWGTGKRVRDSKKDKFTEI